MERLIKELGYNGKENLREIFRIKEWNPVDLLNLIWYSPLESWQKYVKIQELGLDHESSCIGLLEFYGFKADRAKMYNLYLEEYIRNFDGENFRTSQIADLYLGLSYQGLYKKLERENVIRKNTDGLYEIVNGESYIINIEYKQEKFKKNKGILWTREGKEFLLRWLAERKMWPAVVFEKAEGLKIS